MNKFLRRMAHRISTLRCTPEERRLATSQQLASDAIRQSTLKWHKHNSSLWYSQAPEKHGFRFEIKMLVHDWFVLLLATADINIERQYVPNGLCANLLERNSRIKHGSFRLLDIDRGGLLSVVLALLCDSEIYDAARVADAAESILANFQEAVVQLYASDLIIVPYYGPSESAT